MPIQCTRFQTTSHALLLAGLITAALAPSASAQEQQERNPATLMAGQRAAMQSLDFMDGVWRGQAKITLPDGSAHEMIQTERAGPFLDGTVKIVEGRGYNADGSVGFNALGVLSYDPATKAYNFRSYAMGRSGDFNMTVTDDGAVWEIPAGPMTIRNTATIKDGVWHEVGERIVAGKAPVRFFEMTLHRIGDSPWPGAGAIPAQ